MICNNSETAKLLEKYFLGKISKEEEELFEEHLFECDYCRSKLEYHIKMKQLVHNYSRLFETSNLVRKAWKSLVSIFDSIAQQFENPELLNADLHTRCHRSELSGHDQGVHVIDFTKLKEAGRKDLSTQIDNSDLLIGPFNFEFSNSSTYLMFIEKKDIQVPDSKEDKDFEIKLSAYFLKNIKNTDSLRKKLDRSYILKGDFITGSSSGKVFAKFKMNEISSLYFSLPEYLNILFCGPSKT